MIDVQAASGAVVIVGMGAVARFANSGITATTTGDPQDVFTSLGVFGAALGTALAPLLIPHTGSALYLISAVPGAIGLLLLVAAWHVLENMYRELQPPYTSPTTKRALWPVPPSKPSVTCAHAGAHAGATCDSSSNAIPSVSSSEADPQGSYRPPQQPVP